MLRPLRGGAAAATLSELNGLCLPAGLLGGCLADGDIRRLGPLTPDAAAPLMALLPLSAQTLTDVNIGCARYAARLGCAWTFAKHVNPWG